MASAHAQSEQPAQRPPDQPPRFERLRYDEDYFYLRDPAARSGNPLSLEPIKYIPLNAEGDWYLSIGGEARQRYEYYDNLGFGAAPEDDPGGFLLQRYVLHGDLHVGSWLRVFTQLRGAFASFRDGPLVPVQEDGFDVQQAFVDLGPQAGRDEATVVVRLGRQEMSYGSERLISVREASNVRRTFDAARVLTAFWGWRVDGFFARLVENEPRSLDPWLQASTNFWGIYATGPIGHPAGVHVDCYYLGVQRSEAMFEQGVAAERRHTIGGRLFGDAGALDYNFEGMYQWGEFGSGKIRAWAVGSDTGYTFEAAPLTPRAALRANVTSGDLDPSDDDLGTFNPLFPRGNYFGESAIVGPMNLVDVHPIARLHLLKALSLEAGWAFFWRYSTADGFYSNGLTLIRAADGSDSRYIGSELSFVLDWKLHRHLSARASYSHFFTGEFLKDTGPGEDADALIVFATYQF